MFHCELCVYTIYVAPVAQSAARNIFRGLRRSARRRTAHRSGGGLRSTRGTHSIQWRKMRSFRLSPERSRKTSPRMRVRARLGWRAVAKESFATPFQREPHLPAQAHAQALRAYNRRHRASSVRVPAPVLTQRYCPRALSDPRSAPTACKRRFVQRRADSTARGVRSSASTHPPPEHKRRTDSNST